MADSTDNSKQPLEADELLPKEEALETIQELREEAAEIGDVHSDDQDEP